MPQDIYSSTLLFLGILLSDGGKSQPYSYRLVGSLTSADHKANFLLELALSDNPLVNDAVVVGRARNQVGVIIELVNGFEIDTRDDEAVANFRNLIWLVLM